MAITSSDNSASWVVQTWANGDDAAVDGTRSSLLRADFVVRLLVQMQSCADAAGACRLLANRLQQFLGCRQIAIGMSHGAQQRCQVQGLSGVVRFDAHTSFVHALQDALEETQVRNAETAWPPREDSPRHASMAHEKLLAQLGAESVVSVPLRDAGGQIVGVCLLIDAPENSALSLLHEYGTALASCLALVKHSQRGFITRQMRRLWTSCRSWRGRLLWSVVASLSLTLLVPVPYRIGCDCELQPIVRRFVVAPYDGTLEKSLVAPGDVVKQDDVLARMDEREIRWELAGLNADLARAEKERDAALAVHQTSSAQLAKLEMDRLQLSIRLLEHRVKNLAIKSPIGGVVVTGDLQKAEGAPLSIGQSLFEIAPLQEMVAEIYVPEDEIAHLSNGMSVRVDLEAFPGRDIRGRVDRVHPHAEVVDDQSVFIAELKLDNPDASLRPGMNGRASVESGRRNLGWVLFHKPWISFRRALAW